jgi:hypothetical protein
MSSSSKLTILVLVAGLVGCTGEGAVAPREASWLRADVRGAVTAEYEGLGEFWTGQHPTLGTRFVVNSGATDRAGEQTVMLFRKGGGQPPAGTYPLSAVAPRDADSRGFTVLYFRAAGDTAESYGAAAGEVDITRSDEDRIEGKFRATAYRYSARALRGAPGGVATGSSGNLDPGAPRIEVSGSFRAVPAPSGFSDF